MNNKKKTIEKSLRDEIMTEIILQYRENQKSEQKMQKVSLFLIWSKKNMPYSDFIDIILSLDAQGYIHYEKADKNKEKIHTKGEYVPQEFVTIAPNWKSFPEILSDEKANERKLNIKYPVIIAIITALIGILLSNASIGWLSQILEQFLSLFRS